MQLISSFTSLLHIHTTTAFPYKVTPWLSLPLNIIDQQRPPMLANNVNCWWFSSYPTQLRHFYTNSPLCSLPLDIIGQWYYPWYFCDGRVTVHTVQAVDNKRWRFNPYSRSKTAVSFCDTHFLFVIFFFSGYYTSSTPMGFTLHDILPFWNTTKQIHIIYITFRKTALHCIVVAQT